MNGRSSSNRYSLIESLYQRAADLPPDRRAMFLSDACGDDVRLRAEVSSLLEHYESVPQGFLEQPAHDLAARETARTALPRRIGRYEIVRLIGRGGMGAVYEAEQSSPRRRVALKIVRHDAVSEESLLRFRHEADVLAQLRHPDIASIYEFDVGEVRFDGVCTHVVPYLVMELVPGRPLHDFVAAVRPNRRAMLELFARVCDAVQHAHQKGVIHRDLKPANILVSDDGRPKVLDFGVARITTDESETMFTRAGNVLGTIGYMSPEQATADRLALDTRSDVYSLGVILYEMLAARPPIDVADRSITEAARLISEIAPRRLSTIDPALAGDVETIVAKALEKQPRRRYQSAGELGRDVRRHLAGDAIEARRDSGWYVLRKQVARHKTFVTVAAAFMVLIAGSTVAMSILYRAQVRAGHRAAAAGAAAARAGAHAQAVRTFLEEMLLAADDERRRGRALTLREVLDDASRELEQGLLADNPDAAVDVRRTLARTYMNLGLFQSAIPHYQWVFDHHLRTAGPNDATTHWSQFRLGRAQREGARNAEARLTLEACLKAARGHSSPDADLELATMDQLGHTLLRLGRIDEAAQLLCEAFDRIESNPPADRKLRANVADHLGQALRFQGALDQAEGMFKLALDSAVRHHGKDSMLAIRVRVHLARDIYDKTNRRDEAIDLLKEALACALRGSGPQGGVTNWVRIWLNRVLMAQGRLVEAEALLREAISTIQTVRGIERTDSLHLFGDLAGLQNRRGDVEGAILTLEDGLNRAIAAHGDEYAETARWMERLSVLVSQTGDFDRAASIARDCLRVRTRLFGPDHEIVATTQRYLERYAARAMRFDAAAER
jgi:tetratricopeptide (TPR) repeat protein